MMILLIYIIIKSVLFFYNSINKKLVIINVLKESENF